MSLWKNEVRYSAEFTRGSTRLVIINPVISISVYQTGNAGSSFVKKIARNRCNYLDCCLAFINYIVGNYYLIRNVGLRYSRPCLIKIDMKASSGVFGSSTICEKDQSARSVQCTVKVFCRVKLKGNISIDNAGARRINFHNANSGWIKHTGITNVSQCLTEINLNIDRSVEAKIRATFDYNL